MKKTRKKTTVTEGAQTKQLTADGKSVVLGKKYRDTIHGIEGIATSQHQYLAGCDRVNIEYMHQGDLKALTVDIVHLEEVPDAEQVAQSRATGGPNRFVPPSR